MPQFPYSCSSSSVWLEHLPGELLIPEVSAQGMKSSSPLLKASLPNGSLQIAGMGQHLPHVGHLSAPAVQTYRAPPFEEKLVQYFLCL